MRKVFLTTTILLTASTALAFGGVFNHGSKSSTYKGGVDAIGVHVNGKGKADIDIRSCDSETEELVESECCKKTLIYIDNDTTKCCSTEGYAVQDGKCKKQCGEGLVLNEETNECEDACPEERRCGETCCAEENVCVDGKWCCAFWYEQLAEEIGAEKIEDNYACCNANESVGFSEWAGRCCSSGEKTYLRYVSTANPDTSGDMVCCDGVVIRIDFSEEEGWYEQYCCAPDKIVYGAGENGADECLE